MSRCRCNFSSACSCLYHSHWQYHRKTFAQNKFSMLILSYKYFYHHSACAYCAFCNVHVQATMTVPVTKHLHLAPVSTLWPSENSCALTKPRNMLSRVLIVISTEVWRQHVLLQETMSVNSLAVLPGTICSAPPFTSYRFVCCQHASLVHLWVAVELHSNHSNL